MRRYAVIPVTITIRTYKDTVALTMGGPVA